MPSLSMSERHRGFADLRKQSGMSLLMALVFLVVFTLMGIGVVGTTSLEERMARNFRDYDTAFAAAEAALRDAQLRVTGYYTNPASPANLFDFSSTCADGLCDKTVELTQTVHALDFFGSTAPGKNSVALGSTSPVTTGSPVIPGLPTQPRYLIESVCRAQPGSSAAEATCQMVYRLTAQARGRLGSTQVVLQEVFLP